MDPEPPPSRGEPAEDGPSARSRGDRMKGWQTLLAAVVTAVAAIGGVLLTKGCESEPTESAPPVVESTVSPTPEVRQEAYITKVWSEAHPALPPPAVSVHLEGTFKNLQPGTAVVGLLGPETANGNAARQWVVANAVLDRPRSTWVVELRLRRPAKRVLYQAGTASEDLWKNCGAETECLTGPGVTAPELADPSEFSVIGLDPTTPLTDARTGDTFRQLPPGLK